MATETEPDSRELRDGRLARLVEAMEADGLDLLVLGRVANIRYASGVPILWNAGTRPFGPGCVVVRETGEIYLLSTWDEGVPDDIPHDHLFGITWNPMNYVNLLEEIATQVAPGRIGTDAMSPLFAQLFPTAFGEAEILDAGPALRSARRIKTGPEVAAIQAAVDVAESAMAAAVAELEPGVRDRDLTGVFMDAMASAGVTTPSTQDVVHVSGAGTTADGTIATGDLVCFEAGVVAGGYAGEVGRTWPAGPDGASRSFDAAFGRTHELRQRLLDACRPGAPCSGLLDAYQAAGEPVPAVPVAHGLGLGFDDPVVVADLPRTAAAETLDPGVVLVVSSYVLDDSVGMVVEHEAVHITADGPEVLTSSPRWNRT